jgi:hypothetical protein
VEVLNALWFHGWRYYAPESGRGVIAGGIIQMASMPILCGFLLHAFAGRFGGVRRAALGIVIPTVALPATFAATSWPLYVSNYADVPQLVRWVAALTTTALCVLSVVATTKLVAVWGSVHVTGAEEAGEGWRLGLPRAGGRDSRMEPGGRDPVVLG